MRRLTRIIIVLSLLFSFRFSSDAAYRLRDSKPMVLQTGVGQQKEQSTVPFLLRDAKVRADCKRWVDGVMKHLTLKERVGQLFIYTIAPVNNKYNSKLLQEAVGLHKVGGLLFSGGKLENQALLTNRAQLLAKTPLMITFDGEWGLSMRLRGTPVFPKNLVLGCIQDNHLLYEYGREMARQCKALGVQVNFAPVADVNIDPHNPVIGNRSFGEDPSRVADKVIAYASGLEAGGVLSVCKHFPGHGDTDTDSHKALPILPFTRERLDSVELYPFKRAICAGVGGIMVGHLQVPALEPIDGLPSSLSNGVVTHLLQEELGFKGLVFTDALAMKGVSGHAPVSLRALKAGNDLVLAPRNLKREIGAVLEAVKSGEIKQEEIDQKCRKVLTYKYMLGLSKRKTVRLSGLQQRIHSSGAHDLIRRLQFAAVTVLKNERGGIPLAADTSRQVAVLEVGDAGETTPLATQLKKYVAVKRFRLSPHLSDAEAMQLKDSLERYHRILVAVSEQRLTPYRSFFDQFAPKRPVYYLFFVRGKMMLPIQQAVSRASTVVLAHSAGDEVQHRVADLLFGRATANGLLSADIGELFATGTGVTVTPETPLQLIPEDEGLTSVGLQRIDSVALWGIREGAYPGCQVVVMKGGHLLVNQAYGTQTGDSSSLVRTTDLYDVASLSKVAGTLLAVMKLYDQGRFNLTDRVSDYLPFLKKSDKEAITIQELLLHESGLPASIAFYAEAMSKKSYHGKLFSGRASGRYSVKVGANTWANPHFKFDKAFVSSEEKADYPLPIADGLWLNTAFRKVYEQKIVDAPLGPKRYVYSDVGFVLLRFLVEQLAGEPMDHFLQKSYYEPMGLQRTGYLPLQRFKSAEIVPSSIDLFLRKSTLRGFVHDEAAAFQGGVSGNAGLFSTASEMAQLFQMLLNGGELRGHRYLSETTCRLFTTTLAKESRRGLGFDRPDPKDPDKSPCFEGVPASVFGHTGFTGTCAWADPEHDLVYVFFSNRIYPDVSNTKLMKLNIRGEIQRVIYESLEKK